MTEEIDLRPFCMIRLGPVDFSRPVSVAEHTYATDWKVIIEVPRRSGIGEADQPTTAGISRVMRQWPMPPDDKFLPLPPGPWPVGSRPCAVCNGTKSAVKCGCSSDDPHCEICDDHMYVSVAAGAACPECSGDGAMDMLATVALSPTVTVQPKYLRRIAVLPNVRISVDNRNPADGVWFVFDGGRGIIMPCVRPGAEHHQMPLRPLAIEGAQAL